MSMKPLFRLAGAAGLLCVLGLPLAPLHAESLASKLEMQGEMTYLRITDLRTTNRNGLLTIQAEITNTSPDRERLFYRFKWLDNAGLQAWDDEPWKPVLLHGLQKHLIQVVAPTPQATDFRLILQSPNNATNSGTTTTNWP